MKYIAEDCVYHNLPLDPVKGAAAVRATLEGFLPMLARSRSTPSVRSRSATS